MSAVAQMPSVKHRAVVLVFPLAPVISLPIFYGTDMCNLGETGLFFSVWMFLLTLTKNFNLLQKVFCTRGKWNFIDLPPIRQRKVRLLYLYITWMTIFFLITPCKFLYPGMSPTSPYQINQASAGEIKIVSLAF